MLSKLFPVSTSPLTKAVRTLEGVLAVGFNIAMVVIPIVSSSLSPVQAAKDAMILNTALLVSRSGLKGLATLGYKGAPTIDQIDARIAKAAPDVTALAAQITGQVRHEIQSGKLDTVGIARQVIGDLPDAKQVVEDVLTPAVPEPFDSDQWRANRVATSTGPAVTATAEAKPAAEPPAEGQSA